MRKPLLIAFTFILCTITLFAFPDSKEDLFFEQLSKRSSEVITLNSGFVQTKLVKILDTKVVSKGMFHYRRGGEIRFDYKVPKIMSIVMTNKNLKITTTSKTTTYDFTKQRSLAELALIMEACVSGKLKKLPEKYKVAYYLSGNYHVVTITNLKKSQDNPYTKIELHFNLENYSLSDLILYERSEDTTTYTFFNLVING